jgi:transposase
MGKYIMVGMDVHDAQIVVKLAEGRGEVKTRWIENTAEGRAGLWRELKARMWGSRGVRVVLAYEASSEGFGLHDEVTRNGFECYVLAPTKIIRPVSRRRRKTDDEDAQAILETVRAHVLGGNKLPSVWVPDVQTREDREVVRARLDAGEKLTTVKVQLQTLLKRNGIKRPKWVSKNWTKTTDRWFKELEADETVSQGVRVALGSLLRQKAHLEEEIKTLNGAMADLTERPRYRKPVEAMMGVPGVGMLMAMVMLTDFGNMDRFKNRKQVGSYLGLVPTSNESGERADWKGHITHQGPGRVRHVLCQSVWARLRTDREEKNAYERIVKRNPKHKKIAVVAMMRRLGVLLWHVGLAAQMESAVCTATA